MVLNATFITILLFPFGQINWFKAAVVSKQNHLPIYILPHLPPAGFVLSDHSATKTADKHDKCKRFDNSNSIRGTLVQTVQNLSLDVIKTL